MVSSALCSCSTMLSRPPRASSAAAAAAAAAASPQVLVSHSAVVPALCPTHAGGRQKLRRHSGLATGSTWWTAGISRPAGPLAEGTGHVRGGCAQGGDGGSCRRRPESSRPRSMTRCCLAAAGGSVLSGHPAVESDSPAASSVTAVPSEAVCPTPDADAGTNDDSVLAGTSLATVVSAVCGSSSSSGSSRVPWDTIEQPACASSAAAGAASGEAAGPVAVCQTIYLPVQV